MDNLTGADNIRKEMEEKMTSGQLAKKKTIVIRKFTCSRFLFFQAN